jgi:methylenetetrahydrofolate reductase (NADPH)
MRIAEILRDRRGRGPAVSIEFFPPKTPKGEEALYRTIDDLRVFNPAYVSVTWGAGGTTRGKTVEWAARIKHEHGVESMAHLTCVGAAREELLEILRELRDRGIENVLALRGDPPKGETAFQPLPGGFAYASELVAFIRDRFGAAFSIGVAGYPEKHPEAPDLEMDLRHLVDKVAAGADFIVTQLFFENASLVRFRERFRAMAGPLHASTPVIAGLMPIIARDQIAKFVAMCGAVIPPELADSIDRAPDDATVADLGVAWTLAQSRGLIATGVDGLHYYTLNKSSATRRILEMMNAE